MKVENKTIIITDPCYIIKTTSEKNPYEYPYTPGLEDKLGDEDYRELHRNYCKWEDDHDDWLKCGCGRNMQELGMEHYLYSHTIYGDWSCTTVNSDTEEAIGEFCADAGLVAVFILDEVRAYNPEIDNWIKSHPWCVTTIENFTGDVNIEIVHTSGVDEDDEEWEDDEVQVIGKGNVNFFTTQTGL